MSGTVGRNVAGALANAGRTPGRRGRRRARTGARVGWPTAVRRSYASNIWVVDVGERVSPPKGRVKATDVAEHAGVSIATVSLVANGKAEGRVSATTEARVRASIAALGYVVNPAARSLVTGRHHRVALVAHDIANPFIAATAAGVGEVFGKDMQLILAAATGEDGPPDIATISSFGVDGMLVNIAGIQDDPQLGEAGFPVVVLDESQGPPGLSRVYFDVGIGATQLSEHLAGLGHRVVVYLDSERVRETFDDRRERFTAAFRRHVHRAKIVSARSRIDMHVAQALVARSLPAWRRQGATAIVTATDVQAYGVLAALAEEGVEVPDVLSVASFDNNPIAAVTHPPLTSVDLPARELGREAALLVVDQIEKGVRPGRSVILPTSLVVRRSTGPAPT